MTDYACLLEKIKKNGEWDMLVIEGVVGVGKSTLMHLMVEQGFEAFMEPVVDNPILDKFYYDRKRYAFPLQVFFLNRRFEHIKQASKVPNAVMDRSIYGDAIFASMLHDNGEMETDEFNIYKELYVNMLEHVAPPKLTVYLEVGVDEAIRRIRKRNRDYEQIVERDYWEKLNKEYADFFAQYTLSPLLTINVDKLDFEASEADRKWVVDQILAKLKEIGETLPSGN